MAEEKPVHEQVQDLLSRWNAPAEDHSLERVVGVQVEEGDTRATSHVPMEELNRGFHDDGDDEGEDDGLPPVEYDEDGNALWDDLKNADLKEHLAARDLPVSGNHAELVERLEEDDASEEDDESEDE